MNASSNAIVTTFRAAIITKVGSGSTEIINEWNDGNNNRVLIIRHSAGGIYPLYITQAGVGYRSEADDLSVKPLTVIA